MALRTFPGTGLFSSGSERTAALATALRGRPAVLLFWSTESTGARGALQALARGSATLAKAGVSSLAVALDAPANLAQIKAAATDPSLPVVVATEMGLSYAIVNRHLFMNRQDMRLPTTLLLDQAGQIVYGEAPEMPLILQDVAAIEATPAERLSRAVPFPGTFYSPPPLRNYLPYGRELLDQGLERAAVEAFERAAQANPTPSTLYRLGTLLAKSGRHPARGRHSNARLRCSRIWPKPTTTWARSSHSKAIFRRPSSAFALRSLDTGLPGCVEQSRLRVAAEREQRRSPRPLREGDRLATGFPRGPQQPWTALRAAVTWNARNETSARRCRDAGTMEKRPTIWRSSSSPRDRWTPRCNYSRASSKRHPARGCARHAGEDSFQRRSISRGRAGMLERLLQRNPKHDAALELLKQWKGR